MTVERYDPKVHYRFFTEWYAKHVPVPMDPIYLPEVGFVVPGVAMGFLYQTDSAVAHIEALVANPRASGAARSAAIDEVVQAIIAEAKKLGFKALLGNTSLPAVIERAKRLGFVHDPEPNQTVTLML
ncbi:MAG: hypothetical protein IPJ65_20015 [Archangiaceae bacterium]|nr:hypothetical protein [Archangiaceae bacterium]